MPHTYQYPRAALTVDCVVFGLDDSELKVLLIERADFPDHWQSVTGSQEAGETLVETATRELREETGYEGSESRLLGSVFPNPAIMSNTCFTVMVDNSRCIHPVEFDHGEDIITRLVPVSEIPGLVAGGKIRHSLVVVALYHFELWQRDLRPEALAIAAG